MNRMIVPASELRLADVIRLDNITAYNTATVRQVKDGKVTLFRPYTSTADFSYTGGVICYVGIEEWTFTPRPDETFVVLERKELK